MINELAVLIGKLKAKQQELGMTDPAFADRLGISRPLWTIVKNGQHEPGGKFLKAVMVTFPDLQLAVSNYMASGDPVSAGKES
jgi:transcriptional regulator with XRE-family HTH domain